MLEHAVPFSLPSCSCPDGTEAAGPHLPGHGDAHAICALPDSSHAARCSAGMFCTLAGAYVLAGGGACQGARELFWPTCRGWRSSAARRHSTRRWCMRWRWRRQIGRRGSSAGWRRLRGGTARWPSTMQTRSGRQWHLNGSRRPRFGPLPCQPRAVPDLAQLEGCWRTVMGFRALRETPATSQGATCHTRMSETTTSCSAERKKRNMHAC